MRAIPTRSPRDHNGCNPRARTAAVRDHGSRNLQQAETEEEDPRSESEYLVGEVQLSSHVETGEPDVYAVNERRHVNQEEIREQATRNLPTNGCCRVRERKGQRNSEHHGNQGVSTSAARSPSLHQMADGHCIPSF